MKNKHNSIPQEYSADEIKQQAKQYHKPFLKELGDLRTLTLGISLGVGESGRADTHWQDFP